MDKYVRNAVDIEHRLTHNWLMDLLGVRVPVRWQWERRDEAESKSEHVRSGTGRRCRIAELFDAARGPALVALFRK